MTSVFKIDAIETIDNHESNEVDSDCINRTKVEETRLGDAWG